METVEMFPRRLEGFGAIVTDVLAPAGAGAPALLASVRRLEDIVGAVRELCDGHG